MDNGIQPVRLNRIAVWFSLCALCLAGNGCLDAETGPDDIYPEKMARDGGDVTPTDGFQPAEYPRSMGAIRPSREVVAWEMRSGTWKGDSGVLFVLDASVDSCANRMEPCPGPLAGLRSPRGMEDFNFLDPDARNYTYYVGWTGTKAVFWNDKHATRSFLGRIDNETEALYWAAHQGYSLDSAYIRRTEAGFELLMDRMDHMCSPYRLLRVRVLMGTDGISREIGRRTTVETFEACIMH